ncbi:MAG TPA: DUF192 domain-containing protein [Chloroflexota bacterium]|jgi:hypothetical protein
MTVIANATRGLLLAGKAEMARGPRARFLGLIGRAHLAPGAGLVLPRTRGVHTHFMRFPIDVVFYDRHNVVLQVAHCLRPWRFSRYLLRAAGAIELPAGVALSTGTQRGDVLLFSEG